MNKYVGFLSRASRCGVNRYLEGGEYNNNDYNINKNKTECLINYDKMGCFIKIDTLVFLVSHFEKKTMHI